MLAHVAKAQRLRFLDQHAQNAPSTRQVPDRPMGRLVHAGCQELLELGVLIVEDPERCIARSGQLARRLEHALEHDPLIELGRERTADIE
jgi:hypothetical protein